MPNWVFGDPALDHVEVDGVTYAVQGARKPWSWAKDANSNSFRFEVRAGDIWVGDAGRGRERSEFASRSKLAAGVELWDAFGLQTGGALGGMAPTTAVVGQIHATDDPGSVPSWPVISLEFGPGVGHRLRSSWDAAKPSTHPQGVTQFQDWHWQNSRTYDFVRRAVYDHGEGTGEFDVWRDGKQIVSYRGPLGYNSDAGSFPKMGIYRVSTPGVALAKAVACFLNVEGPTETDLSARIAHPPALP